MRITEKDKDNFILFSILFIFFSINIYVQTMFFSGGTYRMFDLPTNDAARWIICGNSILDGLRISSRPLFPAFLSVLIFLFKGKFVYYLLSFAFVRVFALVVSFNILKKIEKPLFTIFFLAFSQAVMNGCGSTIHKLAASDSNT